MENKINIDPAVKKVEVNLDLLLFKEGDYTVAFCPALNLSSFGINEEDAKLAFDEALSIFLEESTSRGSLEKILLDLGWGLRRLPKIRYTPPTPSHYLPTSHIIVKPKTLHERILIPV